MRDLSRLTNLAGRARRLAHKYADTADEHAARVPSRSWYRISNPTGQPTSQSDEDAPAEVYLYESIGSWWGISAEEFCAEFRAITASRIDLRVNCQGGEVFDAITIFEAIARHPATVTAHVDGLAASAASFIVQAANERVMGRHARIMIHDARTFCIGNEADMLDAADLLRDMSDEIASIYADRSGRGGQASWREAMKAGIDGTWYAPQAAVDAGLADRVAEPSQSDSASSAGSDYRAPVTPGAPADSQPADPHPAFASMVASLSTRMSAEDEFAALREALL